jgi:hypothetical protein
LQRLDYESGDIEKISHKNAQKYFNI